MSLPRDAVSHIVDPLVQAYLDGLVIKDDPLIDDLEDYGVSKGFPLIGRASGRWLELLATSVNARRVFEMGSGYGFSAFFFARAVGEGGVVVGSECDQHEIDAHHRLFKGHPLANRIAIHHGQAEDILDAQVGRFDVVFMDIHKEGYPAALAQAIPRLRVGGLILADNALWGGKVATDDDADTTDALREFNTAMHEDSRLCTSILPVGDGLAVGVRLASTG